MTLPLSILDLAVIGSDETIAESLAGSVALAQSAEKFGYSRVWYAEHHNMKSIASSATSVLIAHVAAHTKTIRLRSEEHTSELQSRGHLVCRLLLEKKKQ